MSHLVIIQPAPEPISIDDLRAHLRAEAGNGEDDLILGYLSAARDWAENFLGIAIAPQTWEIALDGFPGDALPLEGGDVSAIVSLKYIDPTGAEQTLSSGAYALDAYSTPNALYPAFNTIWPAVQSSARSVKVRYVVGAGPLLPSIRAALLLFVGHLYANREEASTLQTYAVPLGVQALLQPYRVNQGL